MNICSIVLFFVFLLGAESDSYSPSVTVRLTGRGGGGYFARLFLIITVRSERNSLIVDKMGHFTSRVKKSDPKGKSRKILQKIK